MFCTHCGEEIQAQQQVCVRCGFAAGAGASFCAHCGNGVTAGQAVCVRCGFPLRPGGGATSGSVRAVAILCLVGGIWAAVVVLGYLAFALATFGIGCLFAPLAGLWVAVAIIGILKGSRMLRDDPVRGGPPVALAVLQLICAIGCDPVSVGIGIALLVLMSTPEVKRHFGRLPAPGVSG